MHKNVLRQVFTFIIVNVSCFSVALLMIVLGSLIPRSAIKENLTSSANLIATEGTYPSIYLGSNIGFYDNYTDAISINILSLQDNNLPFISAIANNYVPGRDNDNISSMMKSIEGAYTIDEVQSYSNFWLVGLTIIKSLMVFLNLSQIRYLFSFIVHILVGIYITCIIKKINIRMALATICSVAIFESIYISGNIAALFDVLLMLIYGIILLCYYPKFSVIRNRMVIFFIYGFSIFVLGYVYAPIMGLGMSVLLLFMIDLQKGNNMEKCIKAYTVSMISWFMGYCIAGIEKQFLALGVFGDAIGFKKIKHWSSGDLTHRLLAFMVPIKHIFSPKLFLISIILLILIVFMSLIIMRVIVFSVKEMIKNTFYVFIPFIPAYIYHTVLANAVSHAFYTQNYFASACSVIYVILCAVKIEKNGREDEHLLI